MNVFVKYYPIVCNVYIALITTLYLLGFRINITNYIYVFISNGIFVNAILFYYSLKDGYPFWHRLLIFSMTVCLIPEQLKVYGIYCTDQYRVLMQLVIAALLFHLTFTYYYGRRGKHKRFYK